MKINKLFLNKSMKPHFRYQQNGNIWRLFFNSQNILVAETRDLKTKQAYLFSSDYLRREVYLKNYQLKEKWWFAIDGINNKYVFLSNFQHPEMPEHKGFNTIDLRSGKIIWKNNDLVYYFSNEEYIYAYKFLFEKKITYKLNVDNGEIVEEYKSENDYQIILDLKNQNDISQFDGILNTNIFNIQEKSVSLKYKHVLQDLININLLGEVEYVEYNDLLIYNYHYNRDINNNLFYNRLCVFSLSQENILFEDVLNTNTSSYVPDSFFLLNNFLVYIKEKKEIVIINLDEKNENSY